MRARLEIEDSAPALYEELMELDPIERAQAAAHAMDFYRSATRMLAVVRRKAIRSLVDRGEPMTAIAEKLGISRQQVHRLLQEDDPRPIYELQPSMDGTSWIVTDTSKGTATKFPDKDRATRQAFRLAKKSGGIVLRALAGGGTEQVSAPN